MDNLLDAVSDAQFVPKENGTVLVLVSDQFDLGFEPGAGEAEGAKLVWRSLTRCYLVAVVASTVLALFVLWAGLALLCLSWLVKTYVVQSTRHKSGREVSLERGEYDSFYGQLSRSISRRAAVAIGWAARILILLPFLLVWIAEPFVDLAVDVFPSLALLLFWFGWLRIFDSLANSPQANAQWNGAKVNEAKGT